MLRMLRRLVKIVSLVFFMPFAAGYAVFTWTPNRWKLIRRRSEIAKFWAAGICRIIGLKVSIHRKSDATVTGLLVSNHTTYLDILAHVSSFPMRFMPKIEIKSWPLLGWNVGLSIPIWVDRKNPVKAKELPREIAETLEHDVALIIYPEGTTGNGKGLKSFKSTAFEAILETKFPLIPILTIYDCAQWDVAWYGDMSLLPNVWELLAQKEVKVEIHVFEPIYPLPGEDRKALALRLHDLMSERFNELQNCR